MTQTNLFNKKKQTQRQNKQTIVTKAEREEEGINQEYGISRYKLLYIKQRNKKILLCIIQNYIQYLLINHNLKEKRRNRYVDNGTQSLKAIYQNIHSVFFFHFLRPFCIFSFILTPCMSFSYNKNDSNKSISILENVTTNKVVHDLRYLQPHLNSVPL